MSGSCLKTGDRRVSKVYTVLKMTNSQKIAFERPCLEAAKCAAQEYGWLRPPWSVFLTLNIGLDDASTFDDLPLWHCSVALVDLNGYPLALPLWRDDAFAECVRLVRLELLAGIGDPTREQIEIGDCALHFRRCCSDPEARKLNACGAWPRTRDRAHRN